MVCSCSLKWNIACSRSKDRNYKRKKEGGTIESTLEQGCPANIGLPTARLTGLTANPTA